MRHFDSIVPGCCLNNNHWITISLTGELPESILRQLAADSYRLVVGRLSKHDRLALAKMREGA